VEAKGFPLLTSFGKKRSPTLEQIAIGDFLQAQKPATRWFSLSNGGGKTDKDRMTSRAAHLG